MSSSALSLNLRNVLSFSATSVRSAWQSVTGAWASKRNGIRRRSTSHLSGQGPFEVLEQRLLPSVISLTPSKDNTLFEDNQGDVSDGAGVFLYVGVTGRADDLRRGLLAFDIAKNIPAGSTINSASLSLHQSNSPPGSGTQTLSLNVLLADWGEGKSDSDGPSSNAPGGGGAAATTGDATWLNRFFGSQPASKWTTAGGDFQSTASATTNVNGDGKYTWTSATLKSDVQKWLDDSTTNFGWLIRNTNETTPKSARRFDSRENGTAANRPQLTIDFTPPSTGVTVNVAVAPASVLEDGAANLVYTLTRSGDVTSPLTVDFAVSGTAKVNDDFTATGGATFTATAGTVTFAAGSDTATVMITPSADTVSEPDETVLITVINGTGYSAGSAASASGTIQNDDVAAGPTLVLGDTPVTFKKKAKPIVLLPKVQVQDTGLQVGGAQLVLTMNASTNASTKSTKSFDKIALPKLSAVGKLTSQKVTVGQLVIQIQLSPAATAAKLQTFLQGITFTTTGAGLTQASRILQVQIKGAAGGVNSISQTVNVVNA